MAMTGRPRTYYGDRPATPAERAARCRAKRLQAVPPDVVCRTIGPCIMDCCRWEAVYHLLPRTAALITDPPYAVGAGYDHTKTRRRPSQWTHNFVEFDEAFNPSPWLQFAEGVLLGASHYKDRLPHRGSWHYWDKLAGSTPADFAPGEWLWASRDLSPRVFVSLARGGMRAGEENMSRLRHKRHPAQKPLYVMQQCVQLVSPGLTVIDPFMGSGSTLVAAIREGHPAIGIEMEQQYFEGACAWVEDELQQLALFPQGQAC